MKIRVRFAPSPTGQVHIGNIRTAIFNYLFARHVGGEFLLRIEDTDLERSTREAIDKLLECMDWLKLDYDGEIFYQSAQADKHRAAAAELMASGDAYYGAADESGKRPIFFRLPLNLPDGRTVRTVGPAELALHAETPVEITPGGIHYGALSAKGKPMPTVSALAGMRDLVLCDGAGQVLFELAPVLSRVLAGESFRITGAALASFTRREVYYHDLVKGELAKPLDGMKDQVIVRSDGSPVFHLANVLDDIAQGVTHIIRGDDHVENTYRHLLLFEVFKATPPQYAHLPMIVNAAGKPYSKRDGDAFVGDFRSRGFLAPALFNYLALLGWSPGDDREKLSLEEMVAAFQLERVKSAPAQFDIRKLSNLNGLYVAEMPTDAFTALAREYAPEFAAHPAFAAVAALMQNRTKALDQVRDWRYFFADDFSRDEKNSRKQLTRPEIRNALAILAEKLAGLSDWTEAAVMQLLEQTEVAVGLDHGKLFQPVRLAVTGVAGGAELDRTLCLIGREAVLRRLDAALTLYQGTE